MNAKITNLEESYKQWLRANDYKINTITQYCWGIKRVMFAESLITWQDVAKNISKLIIDYDTNGSKANIGDIGHRTIINALYRFDEFLKHTKYTPPQSYNALDLLNENYKNGLRKEDLSENLFNNVAFLFYSEEGAQGEAGDLIIFDINGTYYQGNYLYGNITFDDVVEFFPILKLSPAEFILNSIFEYLPLNFGNHLFVPKGIFDIFYPKVKHMSNSEIFKNWQTLAIDTLIKFNNKTLKEKFYTWVSNYYGKATAIAPVTAIEKMMSFNNIKEWKDLTISTLQNLIYKYENIEKTNPSKESTLILKSLRDYVLFIKRTTL